MSFSYKKFGNSREEKKKAQTGKHLYISIAKKMTLCSEKKTTTKPSVSYRIKVFTRLHETFQHAYPQNQ